MPNDWRMQALLNAIDAVLFTVDVNARCTGLFGEASSRLRLPHVDVIGRSIGFILAPRDASRHDDAVHRALQGETVQFNWSCHGDDASVEWQVSVSPIRDPAGTIAGVVGVMRDITSLVHARAAEHDARVEAERERARLAAVLDALPVGIAIADERGALVRFNTALHEIWGGAPGVCGIDEYAEFRAEWADTGEPIGAHDWALARAIERGETSRNEVLRIYRFDGEIAYALNNAAPVRDAEGAIVGGVVAISDVTEQRRTSEQHRLLAAALDASENLVGIRDVEGTLLYMNRTALRAFGFSTFEEASRVPIEDMIGPEQASAYRTSIVPTVRRTGHWQGAMSSHAFSGDADRAFLADISALRDERSGEVRAILSVAHDVTELKRAERALRESEARFRTLFENLPVGSVLVDPVAGRMVAANEAAARSVGYTRDELIALSIDQLVVGGRQESAEPESGSPVRVETRQRARDGSLRDILVTMQNIVIDGQPLLHCVGVDLTDLNRANDALRQLTIELEARVEDRTRALQVANAALASADRHKSEFLANMSHELRTPLNAILGFCELLHDGVLGRVNALQRECLDDTLTSGRHLLRIIDDVLDLAKIEAGHVDIQSMPCDPVAVTEEVIGTLRHEAARRLNTIVLDADHAPRVWHTDSRRLKQVLYNYLSNALKHSPPGSEVKVRLSCAAAQLRIEVQDHGAGIEPADQQRLFVAFEQLDAGQAKSHQGTGLGLAYTKRLAESLGGAVGVESKPGEGSTFWAQFADLPTDAGSQEAAPYDVTRAPRPADEG